MTKTLEELRDQIEDEAPFVDIRGYSHNIISCCLRMIDKNHGTEAANQAIRDFDLEQKGWKER